MKIPTLVLPALAVLALALADTGASACAPSSEVLVNVSVTRHFAALAEKDKDKVLALWNKDATVTTLVTPKRVDTIDAAVTRWVASTKPITGTIDSVTVNGKNAVVHAHVEWEGSKWEDTLTLVEESDRHWKLASKTTKPASATPPKSAY